MCAQQRGGDSFESESQLTKQLVKKDPSLKTSSDHRLSHRVQPSHNPEFKTTPSNLKGRVVIYAQQQKMLKRLKKPIEKAVSFSSIGRCQLEMNQLLEFFEEEKNRLDEIWSDWIQKGKVMKGSESFQLSERLSAELRSLYAQALERSIELEIGFEQNQQASLSEESEFHSPFSLKANSEAEQVGRALQHYYATLEHLMKTCLEYQKMTRKLQV